MKKSILETILDPQELSVCFQPIFNTEGAVRRVDSVEALIRGPRGTNFTRADILFDYVRRKKAELAVDQSCLLAICNAAAELPPTMRLNVNVHAVTLVHGTGFVDFFRSQTHKRSLSTERFTLEIVENGPACDTLELARSIEDLRNSGVRIALDDVGLGQANYRMMLDCDPEYFKVDMYFVRGVSADFKRRAVVESLVALAEALDSSIVAEGAASVEDLAELKRMGVHLIQANLLCPAMPLSELVKTGHLGVARALAAAVGSASGREGADQHQMDLKVMEETSFYT